MGSPSVLGTMVSVMVDATRAAGSSAWTITPGCELSCALVTGGRDTGSFCVAFVPSTSTADAARSCIAASLLGRAGICAVAGRSCAVGLVVGSVLRASCVLPVCSAGDVAAAVDETVPVLPVALPTCSSSAFAAGADTVVAFPASSGAEAWGSKSQPATPAPTSSVNHSTKRRRRLPVRSASSSGRSASQAASSKGCSRSASLRRARSSKAFGALMMSRFVYRSWKGRSTLSA